MPNGNWQDADMATSSNLHEPILVPLFADAHVTETDVMQTPADRFHRWLMNFSGVIEEYRVSELMVLHEDLQELLSRPEDKVLEQQVTKMGTWSMPATA